MQIVSLASISGSKFLENNGSMNSISDSKLRLLRLFPVSSVKEYFNPKAKTQKEILVELNSRTDDEIKQFAISNFDLTRQHVFLYDHAIALETVQKMKLLESDYLISSHLINNRLVFNYLYKQVFDIQGFDSSGSGFRDKELHFRQPLRIVVEPGKLKICFTILERSPSAALPDYKFVAGKRREEDKDVAQKICALILKEGHAVPVSTDLNKGVKTLWEAKVIDANSVKVKGSHSTDTYVMDEDSTFRLKYPEKYAEIIRQPLKKMLLKFTPDEFEYGPFECDVSNGTLSFNKYPATATTINEILAKITSNN